MMRPSESQHAQEHVPVRWYPHGTFSDPPGLHDTGHFVFVCSCDLAISDPSFKKAVTDMARHVEQPPSYVMQRVVWQ